MKEVKIYTYAEREQLYEKGESIGLTGEALKMFSYAQEYEIDLTVEEETGKITIIRIEGVPVQPYN
jgi:hypothetical protein